MSKVGLCGVFENYQERATGPSFVIGNGIEFDADKRAFQKELDNTGFRLVYDAYYRQPAFTCFGAKQLDTALCYLYTALAHELENKTRYPHLFVFHTAIDIYAEIIMYHGRQKWLEPVIQHNIETYDLLVHLPTHGQNVRNRSNKHEKYDGVVGRIIHDFKGKYVRASDTANAIALVKQNLNGENNDAKIEARL
jgi:hypothetical protein